MKPWKCCRAQSTMAFSAIPQWCETRGSRRFEPGLNLRVSCTNLTSYAGKPQQPFWLPAVIPSWGYLQRPRAFFAPGGSRRHTQLEAAGFLFLLVAFFLE